MKTTPNTQEVSSKEYFIQRKIGENYWEEDQNYDYLYQAKPIDIAWEFLRRQEVYQIRWNDEVITLLKKRPSPESLAISRKNVKVYKERASSDIIDTVISEQDPTNWRLVKSPYCYDFKLKSFLVGPDFTNIPHKLFRTKYLPTFYRTGKSPISLDPNRFNQFLKSFSNIAFVFDLEKSFEEQQNIAKELFNYQKKIIKNLIKEQNINESKYLFSSSGQLCKNPSLERYILYLRVLDAIKQKISHKEIYLKIKSKVKTLQEVEGTYELNKEQKKKENEDYEGYFLANKIIADFKKSALKVKANGWQYLLSFNEWEEIKNRKKITKKKRKSKKKVLKKNKGNNESVKGSVKSFV